MFFLKGDYIINNTYTHVVFFHKYTTDRAIKIITSYIPHPYFHRDKPEWSHKIDRNNGGYAVTNIDKSGHGGMLFVDLVDVTVTNIEDTQNPIPKKLMNTFKNSVSLSMHFEMDGQNRSVEFRCKDNDEAQFMCTCMKGIRDLLKQERSLRLEMKSD